MSFLRGPGVSQRQELTIRRLSTANLMSNGGFIVAIVFVGLILVAILTLCFFRHYDAIRKACRRRRPVVNKKKRDVRDYKATEVVVKTLDKPKIGGAAVTAVAADGGADSATASVVTATVHDMASIFSGGNHDADFSESSWTTMGNLPVGDGDIPILTNSHTPRSARGESKVVPVDYPVA